MLSLKTKLVTFSNVLSWCSFWSCSIMSLRELKILYIHLLHPSALVFFTCFIFLCVYKILSFSHLNLKRLKENNQYHYYFLMILFLFFVFISLFSIIYKRKVNLREYCNFLLLFIRIVHFFNDVLAWGYVFSNRFYFLNIFLLFHLNYLWFPIKYLLYLLLYLF